ncbi:MAG: hypothetical protein LBH25_00245 [Fibromonadaceae bacterium]|jgi:uncharacterized protein (TIGR02145 family)|nr:hypothetical protein [Fibromonadaceae bacterium]
METKLNQKGVAGYAPTVAAILALALALTLTDCTDGPANDNGGGDNSGGSQNGGGLSSSSGGIDNPGGNPNGGSSCGKLMAENLNIDVEGSVCYNNDPANCSEYGRLYDWATAMGLDASCNSASCSDKVSAKHRGICPSGWHIPSREELKEYGSYECLKNQFGGYGHSSGNFNYIKCGTINVGNGGYWWSADEANSRAVYNRLMGNDGSNGSYSRGNDKNCLYSVRCVQD